MSIDNLTEKESYEQPHLSTGLKMVLRQRRKPVQQIITELGQNFFFCIEKLSIYFYDLFMVSIPPLVYELCTFVLHR
jgi:hypothetical protein